MPRSPQRQPRTSPIRQIVFLGAGWDTRSCGLLPNGTDPGRCSTKLFKVDEPPTQESKVRSLRAAGVACNHVAFAPTDFNQRSWLDSLKEHGFDPELPTLILWEGVTMCRDVTAVLKTLAKVAELAPGSRIAFDFCSRELVFGRKPHAVMGTCTKYALKSFYAESMHFGISTPAPAHRQVLDFFEGRGLEVESFEPLGKKSGRGTPLGGLVVASKR